MRKIEKFLLYVFLLVISVSFAFAATGDLVGSVSFATPCPGGTGVGIAYDGVNLWYSCCCGAATDLYKANPSTGVVLASFSSKGGLGALAWDSSRGKLWAGAGCASGQAGSEIYLIDPSTGVATKQFDVPSFDGNCLDDGLAYDGLTDTLYHSWDGATKIRHLSTTGVAQADDGFTWGGSGCYNSGLAIGGDLLYEGSNGCTHVWVEDKTTLLPAFDFSTAVGSDPSFRDEDLECDTNTFSGLGKHVMWSVEAYEPRRALAFEIPLGSCGVGGKSGQCGDLVLDEGEQCDDGNQADGDGCSANCTLEDGINEIPEFTVIGAGITLLGAAGYALYRRRK